MAQKKSVAGGSAGKKLSSNAMVGIGFGLTAAAVTAAGAYFFFFFKKSSQNRKKVKGWVLKAKGEVLETLEKAESITEDEYRKLVETACGAYGTVKSATAGEVKDFKKEMNDHWATLQKNKVVKQVMGAAKEKIVSKVNSMTSPKKVALKKTTTAKVAVKKAPAKTAPKKGAK